MRKYFCFSACCYAFNWRILFHHIEQFLYWLLEQITNRLLAFWRSLFTNCKESSNDYQGTRVLDNTIKNLHNSLWSLYPGRCNDSMHLENKLFLKIVCLLHAYLKERLFFSKKPGSSVSRLFCAKLLCFCCYST